MSRNHRATLAQETLTILQQGYYAAPQGTLISIETALAQAKKNTKLIRPQDFERIDADSAALRTQQPDRMPGILEVTGETSLEAVRRLHQDYPQQVFCLNFASAKNPGGGFLGGSQAQEESLARCSGLYACIEPMQEYYQNNRQCGSCLYLDYMIYSPQVPVFREDTGALLDTPYNCTFLTAPAVNAGIVRTNERRNIPQIEPIMRQRIRKVLDMAALHQHTALVLGAWGCGVFQNNPEEIARYFADELLGNGIYANFFKHIVFAVYDSSKNKQVFRTFQQQLLGVR